MIEIRLTGTQQNIQLALCRLRQSFHAVTPVGEFRETSPSTYSLTVICAF